MAVPVKFDQYVDFIEPNYKFNDDVSPMQMRKDFNEFVNAHIEAARTSAEKSGGVQNPYLFHSHIGAFLRNMDRAKDHYVKAVFAISSEKDKGQSS